MNNNYDFSNINKDNIVEFFEGHSKKMIHNLLEFPWENETAYAHWLAQTYYMVKHTTTYLCLTAGAMSFKDEEQHNFLLHHLREETNHEKLAFADQESLGWTIDQTPELIETQLMIQSQYYFISQTPYAHYGFFWALEQAAAEAGPKMVKKLLNTYGQSSVSFMHVHSEEDVKHSKEIANTIKSFPKEALPYVAKNVYQTVHLYNSMLNSIRTIANAKSNLAA